MNVKDIPFHGHLFDFECHSLGEDIYVGDSIIKYKTYDTEKSEYWFNHIKPDDLVIDVGANIGWFSKIASLKTSNIIAIEPEDKAFSLLERNCPGIELYKLCAGNSIEEVGLIVSSDNYGDNRTSIHGNIKRRQNTIDNIVAGRKVSAIKIDTQGWEPNVIAGAVSTINNMDPGGLIIMEYWPFGLAKNDFDSSFLKPFLSQFSSVTFTPNPLSTDAILDNFTESSKNMDLFGDFILVK